MRDLCGGKCGEGLGAGVFRSKLAEATPTFLSAFAKTEDTFAAPGSACQPL